MNFDDCQVVDESKIDPSLVQISVEHDEVQRRICSFIDSKREEINRNNQRDFIEGEIDDSCARIASNVYRIKDSKGHLKIKRVCNEAGPGSSTSDKETLNQFYGIEERVRDIEDFIGVAVPVPKNIYERLKAIEDEIHHLKTISPEYFHFISRKALPPKKKTVYSIEDLDKIISAMENKS